MQFILKRFFFNLPDIFAIIDKLISESTRKNKFEAGRVLGSFALKLLLNAIKQGLLVYDSRDESKGKDVLRRMEPLVKLVIDCLDSNNNHIISAALRLLAQLIDWPLANVKKNFKKITGNLLKVKSLI